MPDENQQTDGAKIDSQDSGSGKRVIQGPHEEELYVDANNLVTFLRDLADEVEQGNELTIATADWELPFTFERGQIEIEIDRERDELEIEIEFDEAKQGGDLSVK